LLYEEPNSNLQLLGEISDADGSLVRTFLSPAHVKAAAKIELWMREAGLRTWVDGVGNVHGRIDVEGEALPALLVGSHYDTVVDGGKFDGALGIVVPIAAAKAFLSGLQAGGMGCNPDEERPSAAAAPRRPLEIIAFSDEEGVRFGSTFLGSRAVAGTLVGSGLLEAADESGATLSQVLDAAGYNGSAAAVEALAYRPEAVGGYLEVHMEQGPVLGASGAPLGAVSAIAGQTRLRVSVSGKQGHAGTVPMPARRDSVAAAAEAIAWMDWRCGGGAHPESHPAAAGITAADMLVCTTGSVSVWPGASNVISGSVNFTVDIRAASDSVRHSAVADVGDHIAQVCSRRGLECEVVKTHEAAGVHSEPGMVEGLLAAAEAAKPLMDAVYWAEHGAARPAGLGAGASGVPVLVSGAGHDALAMADLTKVGMVFVRCGNDGISHSPLEHVAEDDVAAAAVSMYQYFLQELL